MDSEMALREGNKTLEKLRKVENRLEIPLAIDPFAAGQLKALCNERTDAAKCNERRDSIYFSFQPAIIRQGKFCSLQLERELNVSECLKEKELNI